MLLGLVAELGAGGLATRAGRRGVCRHPEQPGPAAGRAGGAHTGCVGEGRSTALTRSLELAPGEF